MLTRLDTVSLSISMVTFAKSVNFNKGRNRASANMVGSHLIPRFFRSCAENYVSCCLTFSTQPLNFEPVKPDCTWKYSRTNFFYENRKGVVEGYSLSPCNNTRLQQDGTQTSKRYLGMGKPVYLMHLIVIIRLTPIKVRPTVYRFYG